MWKTPLPLCFRALPITFTRAGGRYQGSAITLTKRQAGSHPTSHVVRKAHSMAVEKHNESMTSFTTTFCIFICIVFVVVVGGGEFSWRPIAVLQQKKKKRTSVFFFFHSLQLLSCFKLCLTAAAVALLPLPTPPLLFLYPWFITQNYLQCKKRKL